MPVFLELSRELRDRWRRLLDEQKKVFSQAEEGYSMCVRTQEDSVNTLASLNPATLRYSPSSLDALTPLLETLSRHRRWLAQWQVSNELTEGFLLLIRQFFPLSRHPPLGRRLV